MTNEQLQATVKKMVHHFGTQNYLAKVAKVRQPSVSYWVSGRTKPSLQALMRIEKASKGKFKAKEIRPELF